MGRVLSTQVEIHFVSSWHWRLWSTYFEMKLVSSMVLGGQYTLRYFLCHRRQGVGLIITCRNSFWIFAGMGCIWSTSWDTFYVIAGRGGFGQHKLICILCGWGLVNTSWYEYCVLAGMGWVWSTRVEMHYRFSQSWVGFVQHMLICILLARWYGMGLLNTCRDDFRVLVGIRWVCLKQVYMHFVCSLAKDGFSEHSLRCMLLSRCH